MTRFRGGGTRGRGRPTGRPAGRPAHGRGGTAPAVATPAPAAPAALAARPVALPESISVSELATHLEVPVAQVIKTLLQHGIAATINRQLDFETAKLVAEELGFAVTQPEAPEPATQATTSIAAQRVVPEEDE